MAWVVDGSNVLGALRWNRESREDKERLTTHSSRFARQERKRLILLFDGAAPSGFARKLGGVSVRFTHPRDADAVVVEITRDKSQPWTVVTSDAGLASRVRRRSVEVLSSAEFARRLEQLEQSPGSEERESAAGDEWESYFSDPNNKIF